jgi:hypothetical protein
MPLITSNTDLKSLSFGHDRPGGASSGQPFLFTGFDIPKVEFSDPSLQNDRGIGQNFFDIAPVTFDTPYIGQRDYSPFSKTTIFKKDGIDIATPILNGLEGIAGGIVNGAEGAINAVIGTINNSFDTTRTPSSPDFLWRKNRYNIAHSFADAVRVTKFLSTPAGIFFIIKQELLERLNVKMEGTTRLYNPAGTIVQAGVNSIGYHLNKSGLNPFERSYAEGGNNGYYQNTRFSVGQLGIARNELDIIGDGPNRLTTLMLNKINRRATGFDQFGVTGVGNRETLIRYNGGPGAPLGIGFTRISLSNPTRQVPLIENKTTFIYDNTNVDSPNYLVPLFKEGRYKVYWVYNPFDTTGDTGTRSVFQQIKLRIPSDQQRSAYVKYFGTQDNTFAILNRNTKTISSSLYSHPGILDNGTAVGKKGTDPSQVEYYTPNGDISPNWIYTASNGASSKFRQLIIDNDEVEFFRTRRIFTPLSENRPGEGTNTSDTNISGDKNDISNNVFTWNGSQIANVYDSLGQLKTTTFGDSGITDFRVKLNGNRITTNGNVSATDYTDFNRENTYQTSKTSYKGNFIPGYGRVLDPNTSIALEAEDPVNFSDIIDFNFTLHIPGGTNKLIDFTAYIEDWSDGVKADWNAVKYMGRAESFYKYGGFSRDASVTFLVPALSRGNLVANYRKLNALAWSVSPSYSDIGLMRGVITYFTMGDYFRKMPTIIKSVDFAQVNDMGWDINREENGTVWGRDKNNYTGQLPKGIKVTVSFTPLHSWTPQVGSEYIGYSSTTPGTYISDVNGQTAITSSYAQPPKPPGQSTVYTNGFSPPQRLPLSNPNPNLLRSPIPLDASTRTINDELNNDFRFAPTQGPTINNDPNVYIGGPTNNFNEIVTPEVGLQNPNYGSGPINTGFNF